MFEDEVPDKKCPKCWRIMQKLIYRKTKSSPSGKLLYMCNHCNYFVKGKKIKEEKKPAITPAKALEDWRWRKKWEVLSKLKPEHKKIMRKMAKEFGIITDDDMLNLKIDMWEFGHKKKIKRNKKEKNV